MKSKTHIAELTFLYDDIGDMLCTLKFLAIYNFTIKSTSLEVIVDINK